MSLFQPSSIQAGSGQPVRNQDQTTPHRPVGEPHAARRRADRAAPWSGPAGAAERIGRIVDSLVAGDDARRTRLVRAVADRITARIAACHGDLVLGGLGQLDPDLLAQIAPGEQETGSLLTRLAAELDGAAVLSLLAQPGEAVEGNDEPLALSLLDHGSAGVREAALDALVPDKALQRFDLICRTLCAARIGEALDRLPLDHGVREDHRRRLAIAQTDAARPPPQQDADEAAFLDRVRCGDHGSAIGLLAAAALVPVESVEAAILLRSRRGLVSLAWRAGYSMRAATLLQSQIAGIHPDTVLVAAEDGSCPIGRSEMIWQIGFLARKLT